MPQNYQIDFKELKSRVTMEMVLRHYGIFDNLKSRGDNLVGTCPIHGSGSNPNQFSVNPAKNVWNCFGDCKAGGNVLDFVVKMEKVSIKQAAQKLQEWFLGSAIADQPKGVPNSAPLATTRPAKEEKDLVNLPLVFALKNLVADHPWFAERGILPETVGYFGLGFCSGRGLMAGRIAIPIHNQVGELVAYVGRAVDDDQAKADGKYKLPTGFHKSVEVYNFHRVPPGQALVIVVESFLSVWALHQAGYPAAVALMGSALSQAQEDLITSLLGPAGRLLLLFDADPAGQACTADCLARFGRQFWVRALDVGQFGPKPHKISADHLQSLIKNAC